MSLIADYSPDAISRSLGAGPFAESPPGAHRWLRMLFKPSFHPEVLLTLTESDDGWGLAFHSAQASLWELLGYWEGALKHDPKELPTDAMYRFPAWPRLHNSAVAVAPVDSERIWSSADAATPEPSNTITLDGMSAEISWGSADHASQRRIDNTAIGDDGCASRLMALANGAFPADPERAQLEHVTTYLAASSTGILHIPGSPDILRFYGTVSIAAATSLRENSGHVSNARPLVIDMSNCSALAAGLYPLMALLAQRAGRTAWVGNSTILMHLAHLRIPAESIFYTLDSAVAALDA